MCTVCVQVSLTLQLPGQALTGVKKSMCKERIQKLKIENAIRGPSKLPNTPRDPMHVMLGRLKKKVNQRRYKRRDTQQLLHRACSLR